MNAVPVALVTLPFPLPVSGTITLRAVRDKEGGIADLILDGLNPPAGPEWAGDSPFVSGAKLSAFKETAGWAPVASWFVRQADEVIRTQRPARFPQGFGTQDGALHYDLSVFPLADGIMVMYQRCPLQDTRVTDGLLRQMLETATCGLLFSSPLRDAEGQIIDFQGEECNQAMYALAGFSREQMLTQTMLTCDPDGRVSGIFDRWVQVVETGIAQEVDHYFAQRGRWLRQHLTAYNGGVLACFEDVTDQRRNQQVDLLQTVIDNIQAGLLLVDAVREPQTGRITDFRYRVTNAYNARLAGKTVEQMNGRLIHDVFPGWQHSDLFRSMVAVVESGQPQKAIFPYSDYGWNGWFDGSFIPVGDGLLYTYIDVTQLKKSELEARQAERERQYQAETFQAVLASMLHAIAILKVVRDPAGKLEDLYYEYIGDKGLRETGMRREQIVGQSMLRLFPGVRQSRFWAAYEAVLETGEPQQFEEHYQHDGYDNYLNCQVVRLDDDRIVSMYQVINDLKKAQRQTEEQARTLRTVLDGSQNGIIAFEAVRNERGKIIDFRYRLQNEANRQRVSRTDEQLLGHTMLEFFPDVAANGLLDKYIAVVETGVPFREDIEYDYGQGKGWYNLSVVKRDDGMVLTVMDKTAEKRAEESLRANQRQLEAANEELRQSNENLQSFAYVASHDLQEPLRKIQAFGELLVNQYASQIPADGQDLIRRMQSASARMSSLIQDILAYSRISTHGQPFAPVPLKEVLQQVEGDLVPVINQAGAILEVDPLPTVWGDPSQLWQLFNNLLGNALKFTKPGQPPYIQIRVRALRQGELPQALRKRSEPVWWEISVSDNGIGFEEKHQERIFQIFQRLHGRSQYPGSGIGLAICRRVVERHQGLLTASSQPGQGATFRIYLPVMSEEAPARPRL
ncbi:hypothetical protein GCM10023189_18130 [Nibrella saemangeumensis]|uniref:histidine kinase n=1 Tax=Nibrella saemangeumensis TaxID=1084526 RepID=A0ABP8MRI1_9BACT